MIPDENGREDLMREAVSLTRRIECLFPGRADVVVFGFNDLDWLFVYPGGDTMYRFDHEGRLRRAFVDGLLYRSSGQTLAELTRQGEQKPSTANGRPESILLRRDLSADELNRFRKAVLTEIETFCRGLRDAAITRRSPPDLSDPIPQFEQGLQRVLDSKSFLAPAIVRRK